MHRKAWLDGLSPKENRDIPPLDYDRVYRLKRTMSDVPVIINGGILGIDEARAHLAHVDGVMLGRAAYQGAVGGFSPSIKTFSARWRRMRPCKTRSRR